MSKPPSEQCPKCGFQKAKSFRFAHRQPDPPRANTMIPRKTGPKRTAGMRFVITSRLVTLYRCKKCGHEFTKKTDTRGGNGPVGVVAPKQSPQLTGRMALGDEPTEKSGSHRVTIKRYQTKSQRKILESIGFEHRPGRTRDEAEVLIRQLMEHGDLPRNCLSPPSDAQLELLGKLGVSVSPDLTLQEVSAILNVEVAKANSRLPATEKQLAFIYELGGQPYEDLDKASASAYIEYLLENKQQCVWCRLQHNGRGERCLNCGKYVTQYVIEPPTAIFESRTNRLSSGY